MRDTLRLINFEPITAILQIVNILLIVAIIYFVFRFLITVPKKMTKIEKDIDVIKNTLSESHHNNKN